MLFGKVITPPGGPINSARFRQNRQSVWRVFGSEKTSRPDFANRLLSIGTSLPECDDTECTRGPHSGNTPVCPLELLGY